ncbi:hypothetical protein KCU95_g39, partial [Aureobasidium melanogenum]
MNRDHDAIGLAGSVISQGKVSRDVVCPQIECCKCVQPPFGTFHPGQIVQHVVSTPEPTKLALHLATRFLLCSLSVQRDTTMNPCSHCFSPSLYFPGEQPPVSRIEATDSRLRGS